MNKKIFSTIIMVSLLVAGCGKSATTSTALQDGQSSSVVATTNTADTESTGTTATPVVKTTPAVTTTPEVKATPSETKTESNYNSVLEAYKAVLQNKSNFFSTDSKKNVHLNDFLTNKEIFGAILKVTHFTVIDMDGDKIPEVVLELSVGDNNPMSFEILHYIKGEVYGYNIVYRGLETLKADGTFRFSNGAADNGWGKLIFQSNGYKIDQLGYSKSSQVGGKLTIAYFINNKSVTKGAFDSFMKGQDVKKDAVSYEFSQKNIETKLAIKP